jgi:serine/threonine protein kinase
MASVFIGEHKLLQSRVAIKVLQRRHLDNPAIERRFFNEAKVIAAIKHSNIVEIYDFGRADSGAAYIVMELLEGENLRQRIRQGVIPERQSIIFARQLAAALAAAHNEGVIHRDLKPDNIFIIEDEEVELGERIKLLDFGIAKRFQNLGPATEQTATGILVGTPAYMSPEQCKGLGNIDGRSDIYSLGVVLYRMVTNQLPFEAGGTGELIGKHLYIEPPSPRELNPEISIALEGIITRCLAKGPGDRFQSMTELIAALSDANDHHRAQTAIDAVPPDLDDESDTLNNAPPVREPSPVPAQAVAPPAVHRVASPIAFEEISATTLGTATGEKVSPLVPETVRSKRSWGFYAGVGCAAALMIGIVAMSAGSGSSADGSSAAPGAMLGDAADHQPPEPDEPDEVAAKGAEAEAEKQAREAEEREAKEREAKEREAKEREAKEREAEAEEREVAAREVEEREVAAELEAKRAAALAERKQKRAELERKKTARRAEFERQADERRKAELERKRKADLERKRAAERRRAEQERKREEARKKKTKEVEIVY